MRAAVIGRGTPGVYNLAGDGEITFSDFAKALGWYAVPVPESAVEATAQVVARLPMVPPEARWIEAGRVPVIMDTSRARKELRWRPKHSTEATLRETVEAAGAA
jgi:UDP-glucose 4-epimerase